jgi:hypothetical protein
MLAAKKRNALALTDLPMAFTSEGSMALIWKVMLLDWIGGLVLDAATVKN